MDEKALGTYRVAALTEGLQVSRSGYYAWSRRTDQGKPLDQAVQAQYLAHRARAGAPLLHADLCAQGWSVSERSVGRSLARLGLRAEVSRRYSAAYGAVLKKYHLKQSMSRQGNCWDNAVVESFFATLKKQAIFGYRFASGKEARQQLFEYIEVYYNRIRRHSTNLWVSPVEFERRYYESIEGQIVH